MTNFILIDPTNHTVQNYDAPTVQDAMRAIGLDPLEVDHGTAGRSSNITIGIFLYEYGLITPKTERYFVIDKALYNGPAVLYAADQFGETISCPQEIAQTIIDNAYLKWLDSKAEAEAAIQRGEVHRPQSSVNGQVCWSWNQPNATN